MAAKQIEFTATLTGATRIGSSTNGNPTWMLHTDAGDYRTQTDAGLGYAVSNHTGGRESWIGKRVTFTATPAGRVWDWRLAPAALRVETHLAQDTGSEFDVLVIVDALGLEVARVHVTPAEDPAPYVDALTAAGWTLVTDTAAPVWSVIPTPAA